MRGGTTSSGHIVVDPFENTNVPGLASQIYLDMRESQHVLVAAFLRYPCCLPQESMPLEMQLALHKQVFCSCSMCQVVSTCFSWSLVHPSTAQARCIASLKSFLLCLLSWNFNYESLSAYCAIAHLQPCVVAFHHFGNVVAFVLKRRCHALY